MADACHDLILIVDLMIAHIDVTFVIHDSDEMTFDNFTTMVHGSYDMAFLCIMKNRILRSLAIFCVLYGPEVFIVIMDHDKFEYLQWQRYDFYPITLWTVKGQIRPVLIYQ